MNYARAHMLKVGLIIALTLAGNLLCSVVSRATPSDSTLATQSEELLFSAIQDSLGGIRSLQADFTQIRSFALFEYDIISSGKIYYDHPRLMRWEILDPIHSMFIYDGENVNKYTVKDNEAAHIDLSGADMFQYVFEQIASWMKGDFSISRDMYTISVIQGSDTHIRLVPISEELRNYIAEIELVLDPISYQTREVRISEGGTDTVRIIFSNVQINPDLQESLFDIREPLLIDQDDR